MHYLDRTSRFVKVSMHLHRHVPQMRGMIEKGLNFNGCTFWTTTFESNMPHSLRFMVDNEMVGMSWIDVMPSTYSIRSKSTRKTSNQLELDVFDYTKIKVHPKCEGEFAKVAPMRILSFDIECLSEKG